MTGDDPERLDLATCFPEFASNLASARETARIASSALRDATGLSRPTLARILAGEGSPLLINLVKISDALSVPLVDLLGPQRAIGVTGNNGAPRADGHLTDPLLARPPVGDTRALAIYKSLCQQRPMSEIRGKIHDLNFALPGEDRDKAIRRAVLDALYHRQVWIDHQQLPRCRELEEEIVGRYNLRPVDRFEDKIPVRVLDLPTGLYPLLQLLAVAGVAAQVLQEVLSFREKLGFADGFSASSVLNFLQRGGLHKNTLVPLVHTPRFAQFELSGATLMGAMQRTHQGYSLRSSIEVEKLQQELSKVEVAVTSCGSGGDDPGSRISRLLREAEPGRRYDEFVELMESKNISGDLLYHFLRPSGREVDLGITADLDKVEPKELRSPPRNGPLVYSASMDCLADIAERGMCLLLVHDKNRAPLVHAAMQRKRAPVSFIVITRDAAEELVEL